MQTAGFNQNLINKARTYFAKKYGRDISVAEANVLLVSLADLYEVMEGVAAARRKAGGATDLISVPLNKQAKP